MNAINSASNQEETQDGTTTTENEEDSASTKQKDPAELPMIESKFWRLERILQLMYQRLSSFEGQLVIQ